MIFGVFDLNIEDLSYPESESAIIRKLPLGASHLYQLSVLCDVDVTLIVTHFACAVNV